MGRVVYLMNVSLDGYVEGPDHDLGWGTTDDELLEWFNDQSRAAGAFVYGRRLYETMAAHWPMALDNPPRNEAMAEFARIWNPKPKAVFSSTIERVSFNSRLVRGDIADEIAGLRAEFDGDLHVAGPTVASALVRQDLVDEYRMVVHPVILGAGTPYFPPRATPIPPRSVGTHAFASGVRVLSYEPVRG